MICKVCGDKRSMNYAHRHWLDFENYICSVECARKERIIVIDTKFNENPQNRIWLKKYFYNRFEADEYFESHPRPNDLICKVGEPEEEEHESKTFDSKTE